ncbi:hypothetical protein GCM10027284_34750 [Cyclobacterium sediminis]
MKSKLLFLPDVLLLLFICLSCERNEFRHSGLNSDDEKTVLSVKNKPIASDQNAQEKSWKKIQDTYLKHLADLKVKMLKD